MGRQGRTALVLVVLALFSASALGLAEVPRRDDRVFVNDGFRMKTGERNTSSPPQYPEVSYGLSAAYYSVRGNLSARLIINNKGIRQLNPRLTLYARDGQRHVYLGAVVGPRTFIDLDLRPIVAEAGPNFEDGSLRLTYTGYKLELGGQVRITNTDSGIGFDEMLTYPDMAVSRQLESVWWLPPGAAARLIVTNTTGADVDATVQFLGRSGRTESIHLGAWQLEVLDLGKIATDLGPTRIGGISIEHTGSPGALLARAQVANSQTGYSSVVVFSDPKASRTAVFHGTGVRVGSNDENGAALRPVLLARNIGATSTVLNGRLQINTEAGEGKTIELPSTTIAAGATELIDADKAWREAAKEPGNPIVGIEFEYTGAAGTVVMSASSVSRDFDDVFRIPLTDPVTEPSAAGTYYMQIDDHNRAITYIKNVTDEAVAYSMSISYDGGVWTGGLRRIQPHQSARIDFGAIRDLQLKDTEGKTIPLGVTSGQLHWSAMRTKKQKMLIGRVEQVDDLNHLSATAACPPMLQDHFCDWYVDADPANLTAFVGDYMVLSIMEIDSDEWDEGCFSPRNPVNINEWVDWDVQGAFYLVNSQMGLIRSGSWGFGFIHFSTSSMGWEHGGGDDVSSQQQHWISDTLAARADWCPGDDTKNAIRQEYQGGSGSGVTWAAPTWKPSCSDITNSGGSSTWDWAQWANHSPGNPFYPHAVVSNSSVYDALEDTKVRYNRGGLEIISFWRSPRGNRLVGGTTYASNSRHLRGDAVDIKPTQQAWNQAERDLLVEAALHGDGVKFNWPEPWGTGRGETTSHVHVDFR